MKTLTKILITLIFVLSLSYCTKPPVDEPTYCWQCNEFISSILSSGIGVGDRPSVFRTFNECNKTKEEIRLIALDSTYIYYRWHPLTKKDSTIPPSSYSWCLTTYCKIIQ